MLYQCYNYPIIYSIEFYDMKMLAAYILPDVRYPAMYACMQRFDPHKWHWMGFYMLILDSLHVYTNPCTVPPKLEVEWIGQICIRVYMGTHTHMGEPRDARDTCMGSPYAYGYAYGLRKMAHMRMGSPYAYGTEHSYNKQLQMLHAFSYQQPAKQLAACISVISYRKLYI